MKGNTCALRKYLRELSRMMIKLRQQLPVCRQLWEIPPFNKAKKVGQQKLTTDIRRIRHLEGTVLNVLLS